jgi:hypothetical protein
MSNLEIYRKKLVVYTIRARVAICARVGHKNTFPD